MSCNGTYLISAKCWSLDNTFHTLLLWVHSDLAHYMRVNQLDLQQRCFTIYYSNLKSRVLFIPLKKNGKIRWQVLRMTNRKYGAPLGNNMPAWKTLGRLPDAVSGGNIVKHRLYCLLGITWFNEKLFVVCCIQRNVLCASLLHSKELYGNLFCWFRQRFTLHENIHWNVKVVLDLQ